MKLAVTNPNLSIIMPVVCNAKCKFCYWEKSNGLTLDRFEFVINSLPSIFEQVSITGGEPTISNELINYLTIARKRFKKIVLNTNGYRLQKEHIELVDYVNISRHHWNDFENEKIFSSNTVPEINIIKKYAESGKVTMNCYLSDKFNDKNFIDKYIEFAKDIGAKVAFRKYFNNLNKLSIDNNDTLISEHSCGACLHRVHIINDIEVAFKYSVRETSEAIGGIYELILQSNGDLTFDWAGKNILKYQEV